MKYDYNVQNDKLTVCRQQSRGVGEGTIEEMRLEAFPAKKSVTVKLWRSAAECSISVGKLQFNAASRSDNFSEIFHCVCVYVCGAGRNGGGWHGKHVQCSILFIACSAVVRRCLFNGSTFYHYKLFHVASGLVYLASPVSWPVASSFLCCICTW